MASPDALPPTAIDGRGVRPQTPKRWFYHRRGFWFSSASILPGLISAWSSGMGAYFAVALLDPDAAKAVACMVALCILFAPIAEEYGWIGTRNVAAGASMIAGTFGLATLLLQASLQVQENERAAAKQEYGQERREAAADLAADTVEDFRAALRRAEASKEAADGRVASAEAALQALTPPPPLKLPEPPETPEPPNSLLEMEQEIAQLQTQRECELNGSGKWGGTCRGWQNRTIANTKAAQKALNTDSYAGVGKGSREIDARLQAIAPNAAQLRREHDTAVLAVQTGHREAVAAARSAHQKAVSAFQQRERDAQAALTAARDDLSAAAEKVTQASETLTTAIERATDASENVIGGAREITRTESFVKLMDWVVGIYGLQRDQIAAERRLQALRASAADAPSEQMLAAQERVDELADEIYWWGMFSFLAVGAFFQFVIDRCFLMFSFAELLGYAPEQLAPNKPRHKQRRGFLGLRREWHRLRAYLFENGDDSLPEYQTKADKLAAQLTAQQAQASQDQQRLAALEQQLAQTEQAKQTAEAALAAAATATDDRLKTATDALNAVSIEKANLEARLADTETASTATIAGMEQTHADAIASLRAEYDMKLAEAGAYGPRDYSVMRAKLTLLRNANPTLYTSVKASFGNGYAKSLAALESGDFDALTDKRPKQAVEALEHELNTASPRRGRERTRPPQSSILEQETV